MKRGIKQYIFYPAIVGIVYWLTDGLIIYPFFSSTKGWIIAKTIGLPAISIAMLMAISRIRKEMTNDFIIGFISPVWIWLLSGLYFPILNAIGGKSLQFDGLGWMLIAFPITAIEVSTYSGGLGGLVLASISLPIAGIIIAKIKKSSNTRLDPTGSKPSAFLH